MDNTGVLHNSGLQFLISANPATEEAAADLVNQWATANNQDKVSIDELLQTAHTILAQDADFVDYINSMPRSESFKAILHEFMSSTSDLSSYPNPESISFCDYKDKITAIEKQVISSSEISDAEKNLLLEALSVGRYSAYLHWQQLSPELNPLASPNVPVLNGYVRADLVGLSWRGELADAVVASYFYEVARSHN